MKKFLSAFALAALIGFTGCEPSEEVIIEEPVLETTPAPSISEPVVTPPPMTAPMTTDSAAPGTVPAPPTTTTP